MLRLGVWVTSWIWQVTKINPKWMWGVIGVYVMMVVAGEEMRKLTGLVLIVVRLAGRLGLWKGYMLMKKLWNKVQGMGTAIKTASQDRGMVIDIETWGMVGMLVNLGKVWSLWYFAESWGVEGWIAWRWGAMGMALCLGYGIQGGWQALKLIYLRQGRAQVTRKQVLKVIVHRTRQKTEWLRWTGKKGQLQWAPRHWWERSATVVPSSWQTQVKMV